MWKCERNHKEEDNVIQDCHTIIKHDFWCVIIIFSLIIIGLLTAFFADNANIFNYFSFASTITSISLSVIAIIMTLLAEAKNDETKTKMSNFVDKIEKISSDTKLQAQRIENIFRKMEEMYPIYEKIAEQQEAILSKQDKMIRAVEEGMHKADYKDKINQWKESTMQESQKDE